MRTIGKKQATCRYIGKNHVMRRYIGDKLVFDDSEHIQDGLLYQFKGFNNTAAGVYDPTSSTWTDLKSGVVANLQNASWQNEGVLFAANNARVSFTGLGLEQYTIFNTHIINQFIGSHPRIWAESPYPSLYLQSNHGYGYAFYGQGKDTVFPERFTPPPGEKVQAALRWDGSNVDLFVNGLHRGRIENVSTKPTAPMTGSTLFLGNRADNARYLRGSIFEHMVYTRALSDMEMAHTFAVSKAEQGI